MDPRLEAAAREVLAAPPRTPRNPSLFSSEARFGEPGTYPDGTPGVPASGPAPDEHSARAALASLLPAHLGEPDAVATAIGLFSEPALEQLSPPPATRAALVLLCGTVVAPVLADLLAGRLGTPFRQVLIAPLPGSDRVVAPAPDGDIGTRVLNDRYAAEHPAAIAPALARDLLWSASGNDQTEEATLHALLAMVHLQIISRSPWIAHLGTELTRRQNSFAVTLAHSRHPGSAAIAVRADDGPGTLPGGAPEMSTPDFWSIPFAPGTPSPAHAAPTTLAPVLAGVAADPDGIPHPLRYDSALGAFWREDLGRRWLDVADHLRAGVTLGVISVDDLAIAAGMTRDATVRVYGLGEADACWW